MSFVAISIYKYWKFTTMVDKPNKKTDIFEAEQASKHDSSMEELQALVYMCLLS